MQFLATKGVDALHWSAVGDARATDATSMRWALDRGYAVFTHDLDFSAILATAGVSGASVQVRAQNVLLEAIGEDIVRVLVDHAAAIDAGAIVTLDELGARVRVLPIRGRLPRS